MAAIAVRRDSILILILVIVVSYRIEYSMGYGQVAVIRNYGLT